MASRTKIAQRIAELSHEDIAVRRKAALKLGKYGDPIALPELCAALRDESWKVQRNAAKALGNLTDPAAVEALTSVFIDSPRQKKYRSVRKEALLALGQISTEAALEVIDRVWREEHDLHDVAIETIRAIGLPAVPMVCRALAQGYTALTPPTTGLRLAAIIVGQSLAGLYDALARDAHQILSAWLNTYSTEVFAAILATGKLSPHDKYSCLEILRRRRVTLHMIVYFRDTRSFCEQFAATDKRDEGRAGARSVLNYITLARGSERPIAQSNELLRAAQATPDGTAADELVRGADEPEESLEEKPAERAGLVARALRLIKRNYKCPGNQSQQDIERKQDF